MQQDKYTNIKVRVPLWMECFIEYRSARLQLSLPIRRFVKWLWFWPAIKIQNYNLSRCVNYIPDWNSGDGTKVRPFFGLVMMWDEGGTIHWQWWKHFKRYKLNPRMAEIEKEQQMDTPKNRFFGTAIIKEDASCN